ncbi:ESF1 homolog [Polyodon spathula]|uniref:ESF1 homolog n=1 Tax=Polyodon spathula TaxID=7913 RepID=UPI001B7DC7FB|nr:ESF1 homolog [Polyodon spathula]
MASKPKQDGDDRFNRVMKDPRFWEMPERQRKIKIDKRFQAMFHDKQFKLKYTVDKRGRPINHSSTDDLKRFYDLSDSEESDHEDKKLSNKKKKKKVKSKAKVETEDVRHLIEQNTEKPKTKGKSKSKKEKEATCGTVKCKQLESESPNLEVSIDKLNKKSKAKNVLQSTETEGRSNVEPVQEGQKIILAELKKQKTPENKKLTKLKMKDDLSDEGVAGSENESYGSIDEESESAAELSEDDEDEWGQEEEEAESDEDDSDEGSDSEEESDSGPDLARGKGNIETSSEEDEEDDLTDLLRKEEDVEHDWGELWKDAPRGDTVTRRLAVCNMDWDRLKAKDLLALLNSFKPKGGVVLSVKIHASKFGEERMQAEQLQGPLELVALPEDPEKDTEQERIYREKMREYQLKRMKYFYAVVDCDSPETASKIYEECDGFEYESSCSFVDLRFIPDDVMFDEEPKDVAADVDLASYTPKYFTSTAMATSKVELTWDETDHERVTALSRNFKKDEILDMDFQAYLASSSEEEVEEEKEDIAIESEQTATVDDTEQGKASRPKKAHKDDEEQIAKYRELLKSIQEKDKKHEDKDMEMEIKWVPGLKETAEQLVKKKLEGKDNLTPWETFLEKKKEKKKLKKKADVKKVRAEDLSDDELPPDVDLDDPYFAEEFGKAGIGQKKKSKKNKKSKEDQRTPEEEAEVEKQKAEMSLLMMDDEDDNKKHFNYDKIVEQQNLSKKKKKKLLKQEELLEEDEFQVDVSDPRFQAMYTSHLFNLDPSEPGFKKTKATQRIVEEKMRRREEQQQQSRNDAIQKKERQLGEEKEPAKKTLDPGLSMLIKSIKSKTQQFQARKKLKTK